MCCVKWPFFILVVLYLETVFSDTSVGNSCILTKTGAPGTCKLLSNCESVRISIIKHQQLPQTCGFQETQAMVCCPKGDSEKMTPGVISKMKCKEYSSFATEECREIIVNEGIRRWFPHMAIIGFEEQEGEVKWLCSGNIISEYFILTTASCLNDVVKGTAKYVRVDLTHLNTSDHRQEFEISKLIPHPDYSKQSVYNDIGLIKLKKAINLNSYARPACLYTESEISAKEAIATGWGATEFAGERSDPLLKVTLNLVDFDTCNKTFEKTRRMKHGANKMTQICAGGNDGKDTCVGDSGGPLQIYHTGDDISCMYDIVGIISQGKACGFLPGLYTKVSSYVKWIEDIVWLNAA